MQNQKKIKGMGVFKIFVWLVLLGAFVAFSFYATGKYTDLVKKEMLNNVYAEMTKIKVFHFENGKMPSSPELVGIKFKDILKSVGEEKSEDFEVARRIELTPNQIIIILGPGFDGNEGKTLILEVTSVGEDGVKWSCNKGSLSNKYRPENCKK